MSPTPHPIVDFCRSKGKEVRFVPTQKPNRTLFDHEGGKVAHQFEYRGEWWTVSANYDQGLSNRKLWNRLLREIRQQKKYVDDLWENGAPEGLYA